MREVYVSLLEKRLNRRQPPGRVIDAMGIKPWMRVAEVWVWRGRYGAHVAQRLGDSGLFAGLRLDNLNFTELRALTKGELVPLRHQW